MTIRLSDGLRNFLQSGGSLKQALSGGKLKVYEGAQPANANAAPTGNLLVVFTSAGGSHTAEVLSTGSLTLTGTSGTSVNTVTVNSIDILGAAVAWNASLTGTAADVATQINRNRKNLLYTASASGAVITIKAKPGLGALPNTWVVGGTYTGGDLGGTPANMSGGVDPINGLSFDVAGATVGQLSKLSTQLWQGTAGNGGTAGWFRFEAAVTDSGALDSTATYLRLDGAVAASGSDLNMGNPVIVNGTVQTLSTFNLTEPAA